MQGMSIDQEECLLLSVALEQGVSLATSANITQPECKKKSWTALIAGGNKSVVHVVCYIFVYICEVK